MTTTSLSKPPLRAPRSTRAWQAARWSAFALCLLALLVTVLAGTRVSRYSDLQADLAAGRVDEVRVEGAYGGPDGVAPGQSGTATVRIRWQDGPLKRLADVRQVTPDIAGAVHSTSELPVIVGRVDTALQAQRPGLNVLWGNGAGSWATMFGWQLDQPWFLVLLLGPLVTLFILANGPEPRGATPWAWFWLFLSPAGLVALLVYLAWGARGRVPGQWRQTGGWAVAISWWVLPKLHLW